MYCNAICVHAQIAWSQLALKISKSLSIVFFFLRFSAHYMTEVSRYVLKWLLNEHLASQNWGPQQTRSLLRYWTWMSAGATTAATAEPVLIRNKKVTRNKLLRTWQISKFCAPSSFHLYLCSASHNLIRHDQIK